MLDFNTIKSYTRKHLQLARKHPVFAFHLAMAEVIDVDVTNYMRNVGFFDFVVDC